MKKIKITVLLILSFLVTTIAQVNKQVSIIPIPKKIEVRKGAFHFNKKTKIYLENSEELPIAKMIQEKFQTSAGIPLEIINSSTENNVIIFKKIKGLNKEEYILNITPNKILIEATDYNGFLYGWESLRQLLPNQIENTKKVVQDWSVPVLLMNDSPRFAWRGLMLDVARHFFPKEYIFKTIDRLALLKMNVLHLHLVDDQGWRMEIKKYPKLTEVGAWRVNHEDKHWDTRPLQKKGEKATYGGFYTQKELREMVAYAKERGITIVPEIEMPAHVTSAVAAYPELSCTKKPVTVPSGGVWPITDIYCAGKENTFKFLEDVLTEVMAIFPSKYIHIGGDEATKTNWKKCKFCQERIKKEGLKDEKELQSYFIKRIERFLAQHHRKLIGWDEILEGGLAPEATVMSWRGFDGGIKAANSGHDVVMTPGDYCYFDAYQGIPKNEPIAIGGYKTLSKVYDFEPIPKDIEKNKAHHILGGQANLWSEYISTPKHSEYMLYPRIFAMSEVLWSPKGKRNKKDFFRRVKSMMQRFDVLGINYAKSIYQVTGEESIDKENPNSVLLALKNEIPERTDIRYTINDPDLEHKAIAYTSPLRIKKDCVVRAALFKNNKSVGNIYTKNFKFHSAVGAKVTYSPLYNMSYSGQGKSTLVNLLRGTEDFHDGQWQAWLNKDVTIFLDLKKLKSISQISVGMMEKQNSGIYFPLEIIVYTSSNGKDYKNVGIMKRPYKENGFTRLRDFDFKFTAEKVRFIKVFIKNIVTPPKGGDAWLFVDEILVK